MRSIRSRFRRTPSAQQHTDDVLATLSPGDLQTQEDQQTTTEIDNLVGQTTGGPNPDLDIQLNRILSRPRLTEEHVLNLLHKIDIDDTGVHEGIYTSHGQGHLAIRRLVERKLLTPQHVGHIVQTIDPHELSDSDDIHGRERFLHTAKTLYKTGSLTIKFLAESGLLSESDVDVIFGKFRSSDEFDEHVVADIARHCYLTPAQITQIVCFSNPHKPDNAIACLEERELLDRKNVESLLARLDLNNESAMKLIVSFAKRGLFTHDDYIKHSAQLGPNRLYAADLYEGLLDNKQLTREDCDSIRALIDPTNRYAPDVLKLFSKHSLLDQKTTTRILDRINPEKNHVFKTSLMEYYTYLAPLLEMSSAQTSTFISRVFPLADYRNRQAIRILETLGKRGLLKPIHYKEITRNTNPNSSRGPVFLRFVLDNHGMDERTVSTLIKKMDLADSNKRETSIECLKMFMEKGLLADTHVKFLIENGPSSLRTVVALLHENDLLGDEHHQMLAEQYGYIYYGPAGRGNPIFAQRNNATGRLAVYAGDVNEPCWALTGSDGLEEFRSLIDPESPVPPAYRDVANTAPETLAEYRASLGLAADHLQRWEPVACREAVVTR